ncbi:phosphotransferase system enzyme I (PtsI) [Elusimicrobium simillimum]|uniref:phosphoenolpyruvate--protein phosphotransferase n=1 Tax=Elusimicrobium simillimum TaxID=3143438 RepID=UPI003C6F7D6D
MEIIKGIAASPGVAIGPASLYKHPNFNIEARHINAADVAAEISRVKKAYAKSIADLVRSEREIMDALGPEYAQMIATHKVIMEDPSLKESVKNKIEKDLLSAETAIYSVLQEIVISFDNIADDFFKERKADVYDVAKRILTNLTGSNHTAFERAATPSILIGHNLLPSDTLTLKDHNYIGFVTDIGGKTSHTALLAQSLELPAVVGSSTASKTVKDGDIVIVDGESGLLIINPDHETLVTYKRAQREIKKSEILLKTINDLPFVTTDGKQVHMMINYDPRLDSKETKKLKTDGLGLLRTEFIYMDRSIPPSEQEQTDIYVNAAKKFDLRPVHIRLADLGGDKVHSLHLGDYSHELNPFMGCRGVRLLLKYPALLTTQLRAIVRAASIVPAQIKMIVPMVSCITEVRAVRKAFDEVLAQCAAEGIVPKTKIDYGIMVEVPSTALALDSILPEIDFVSIGTNDLIQYIIAVDRVNQEVASLYDPYHPGVIRIINHIIQTCAQKNKSVSICGEVASDPNMVPLLIGLGVNTLSTTPRMFLRIKNRLRTVSYDACANLAQAALLMDSSEEIKKLSLNTLDENS